MFVQWSKDATSVPDGECMLRRLFPWKGLVQSPWGSAWVTLEPGKRTSPQWHDEEEAFIILSGTGEMSVDAETRQVGKGDVIYMPRCSTHWLKNTDPDRMLEMLNIWWGGDETTVTHQVQG